MPSKKQSAVKRSKATSKNKRLLTKLRLAKRWNHPVEVNPGLGLVGPRIEQPSTSDHGETPRSSTATGINYSRNIELQFTSTASTSSMTVTPNGSRPTKTDSDSDSSVEDSASDLVLDMPKKAQDTGLDKKSQRIKQFHARTLSNVPSSTCSSTSELATPAESLGLGPQSAPQYVLTDLHLLSSTVSHVPCKECSYKALEYVSIQNQGFSHKIALLCKNCGLENSSSYSSKRVEGESTRPVFDVNRRMTQSFCAIGRGHSAMEQFSMTMNMSILSASSYNSHAIKLHEAGVISTHQMLEQVRDEVRAAYQLLDPSITSDQIIHIPVSFDGSWQKRGFTSMYGLGCVIDLLTGYVIDFEILSKYCQVCKIHEKNLDNDSDEFQLWSDAHSADCLCNYTGSSPGMEVRIAETLWKRSESHKFRYTTLLSDGDEKTYNYLVSSEVYGPDIQIEKEECVNHVAKRLGTALRNVVKDCRTKGVTLGGKKYGHLTDTTIKKLTRYYTNAIMHNNQDVLTMKTAVYATLHHNMSSDAAPQHSKCPQGSTSWCFYNRAKANGTKPENHKDKVGTPLLPWIVAKIMPVYQRLATDSLLERCLNGRTQNANESLHSRIWRKCPKETFVSARRVMDAVGESISEFNLGCYTAVPKKMEAAKIVPGVHTESIALQRDKRRASKQQSRSSEAYEAKRRLVKLSTISAEEAKKRNEGVTYGAGAF